MTTSAFPVLLDLDGTLVDSVYVHVLAWQHTLREHGYDVPAWRIHSGIGMGGDKLVPWLLGRHVPDHDRLVRDHEEEFLARADALRSTAGARELIDDLDQRDISFEIATSATGAVAKALLTALGRPELSGVDTDQVGEPKPAPDLLLAACDALGAPPERVTLVGDSPWDAEAARRVGMRSIGVRTGGFSADVLRQSGAIDVVAEPAALVGRL